MAYRVDENGNITCYQGDTIKLAIGGIDTSKDYHLFFEIRNSQRQPVGSQQDIYSNHNSDVEFVIPASTTDAMTVPAGQDTETYYYGVKAVSTDGEDTFFLGYGSDFATENTITVYPKKVEGV